MRRDQLSPSRRSSMSRRDFLTKPATAGVSVLALQALGGNAFADAEGPPQHIVPAFHDDGPVPIRPGLGILIVGASSGLGAEMARQYADHGARIVLAARRVDRLQQVAADVAARGGVAHVIPTDVRDEAQCVALVHGAIAWLASQSKVIDLLVLGSVRGQAAPFGPEMSSAVWANVINTGYYGPAHCLRYALPHLKSARSTVFYFNSVAGSFPVALALGYTSIKHAWRGVMNLVKFENPELTIVSSHFGAIDTEGWDKSLTCFDNDMRYCPSEVRTYFARGARMYPEALAVQKAIQAIERRDATVFLSLLNKASFLIGLTHPELGRFLSILELFMGYELAQQLEVEIVAAFRASGGQGYARRLLRKLDRHAGSELVQAAARLRSLDPSVALYLLALDDRLDPAILPSMRQRERALVQSLRDGTSAQLLLALSSGVLSPPGIAADDDGLAPVAHCPPATLPG